MAPLNSGLPTFIDSGGAFIFMPQDIVNAYYAQVPSGSHANIDVNHNGNPSPVVVYPCGNTLPDLSVWIGSYKAVIQGKLLQGSRITGSCKLNLPQEREKSV